jgi:DNA-binding response OmpR family regulator
MPILVVEDEPDLTDLLRYILRRAGHDVIVAFDGETALRLWREQNPELVLLDIGLPRTDGWEVCRTIRSESPTPIVILTGNDTDEDVVRGLDMGADDYLVKPFSPKQLQARVSAVLRRAAERAPADASTKVTAGDLVLDGLWRTVTCEERETRLTRLEHRILYDLALHSGQVVPHDVLIQRVWGYPGEANSSIIKGHIRNIRSKLSEIGSDTTIRVIPGVGYMLGSA